MSVNISQWRMEIGNYNNSLSNDRIENDFLSKQKFIDLCPYVFCGIIAASFSSEFSSHHFL